MSWIFSGLVVKSLSVIFMDYLFTDKSSLNLPTNWHATNSVGTNCLCFLYRKGKGEKENVISTRFFPFSPSEQWGRNWTSGLTVSSRIFSSCCLLEHLMFPLRGVKFPWYNVLSTKKEYNCYGVDTGPVSPLLSFCIPWLCYSLIIPGLTGDIML